MSFLTQVVLLLAVAICASAQLIPAPIAYRVPSHDSAIIQSHRLGGNFAYSTHEAHAHAVQTPIISQRVVPVGVSYVPGAPVFKTSTHVISHKVPQVGAVIPYSAPLTGALPLPYALAPAVAPVVAKPAEKPVVDTL